MRRKILIRIARAAIPLLRLAAQLAQDRAEETDTPVDDALAEAVIQALNLTEEILSEF